MIRRPCLPIRAPEDVIPYLGSPTHWKPCFSAKAIADAWFQGLPVMVAHTLQERCEDKRFAEFELIDAFLERKTNLGKGSQPSQADVLAILGLTDGLAVMTVEGKVVEAFGKTIAAWGADAKPGSGKPQLLSRLASTLGLEVSAIGHLRYQLLHRTASAIYEARRYRAKVAVMMVHSFDPQDTGMSDYRAFASALGFRNAEATLVVGPVKLEDVDLYLGWTADLLSNEGLSIVDGRKVTMASSMTMSKDCKIQRI